MHIPVVDDKRVIADTLSVILKGAEFEVTVSYSGESAPEPAKSAIPHVLLSDVIMGKMSGIDLALALKQQCPDCKVILFSGQLSTAELFEEVKANGSHFEVLEKPMRPPMIIDRLRQIASDSQRERDRALSESGLG